MPSADMEEQYSVGVRNKFQLSAFDDDDNECDPYELMIRAAQEKPKKEKGAKKDPKAKNIKEKASPKEETPTEETSPEGN